MKNRKYKIEFISKKQNGSVCMDNDIINTQKNLFNLSVIRELEKKYAEVKKLKGIAICNVFILN